MTAAPRSLTVGLLWHSLSSDNLGVGALSVSQMALCQAAAQPLGLKLHFIVFGTQGHLHYPPRGVDWEQGRHYSLRRALLGDRRFQRDLKRCDIVLDIGEGDSFADIYGPRRLLFLLATKWSVLRAGVPLVLSPQTIGPFEGRMARWLAAWLMRRCARVFARDTQSRAVLAGMGLDTVAESSTDLAFALPWRPPAARADALVHVGLNVSGLLFAGGYTRNNQFGLTLDYAALVRGLLRAWVAMPGVQVWLIPHVLARDLPVDDDRVAIAQLALEFPAAQEAPAFDTPSDAKRFIAGMDFVSGARMHACIAALSCGVAVVPLAYSRKFNGLLETLGYPHLADGRADSLDTALQTILQGFAQRQALRQQAAAAARRALGLLDGYQAFLRYQFQRLAAKE